MNFRQQYNSLSIFQKIQLYFIPALLLIFLYTNGILENKPTQIKSQEKIQISPHKQLSHIEIVSFFEDIARKHQIQLCGLKIEKNDTIFTKFKGEINNLLKCIQTIESHYPLISFHINIQEANFQIEALFDIKRFHYGTNLDLPKIIYNNHPNTFIKLEETDIDRKIETQKSLLKQETQTKKQSHIETKKQTLIDVNNEIKVDERNETIGNDETNQTENLIEILPRSKTLAIVGEYVLLNKEWLKVGDTYKGYSITQISNGSIQFKKKNQEAIMEMFDNE